MNTSRFIILGLLLCLARPLVVSAADTATVTVTVPEREASEWTVDRIKKDLAAEVKDVPYQSHGKAYVGRGVPLLSLLKASGCAVEIKMDPKADPKVKLPALRLVVAIEARDGYAVAFSLAELLPEIGNRPAWVLFEIDGKPLTDRDAPLKLVVPSDDMPARGIRAIESIRVATVPTTQPAP